MSRLANALIAFAVMLIALVGVCGHYTVTNQAFEDGQWFERQQNPALAGTLFWLDRTSGQIRFRSRMELGKFLYERTHAIIGEAERNRYYDAAVDAFASVSGPTEADVAEGLEWAALALWYRHDFRGPIPRAEDFLRRAIAIRQRHLPIDHDAVDGSIQLLAGLLTDRGVKEQDQQALAEAKSWNDRLLTRVYPNGHRDPLALELCGDIAVGQNQWADAEACYTEAHDAWEKSPMRFLNPSAEKLVPVLQAQGKNAEAEIWKKRIPQYRDPMQRD